MRRDSDHSDSEEVVVSSETGHPNNDIYKDNEGELELGVGQAAARAPVPPAPHGRRTRGSEPALEPVHLERSMA